MLNETQNFAKQHILPIHAHDQRNDYINSNTSKRIYFIRSSVTFYFLIIRLPSSPFSPLQPLMPFPSMPGSPIRSERKDDKTKNITHNCWILYSVQLSSQAFQLLLIGIASLSVLAISPVFIRHSALIGSF